MKFQYSITPPHFSCYRCSSLNSHFQVCLTSTFSWSESARFFLWGCVRGNIYATEVQDCDSIISCILVAATYIKDQPEQLVCIRVSILCQCEARKLEKVTLSNSVKNYMELCESPTAWCDVYVKCVVKFKLKRPNKLRIFAFHLLQLNVINKDIKYKYKWNSFTFVRSGET